MYSQRKAVRTKRFLKSAGTRRSDRDATRDIKAVTPKSGERPGDTKTPPSLGAGKSTGDA